MEHAEFEALHLLNMAQVSRLNPNNAMLEQLRHFWFLGACVFVVYYK